MDGSIQSLHSRYLPMLDYCCKLLIGLAIRSSEKMIHSGSEQIKCRFKTLMVTIGESATHLNTYQPGAAMDWLNSKPWDGILLLGILSTKFKSPGKDLMGQIRMVTSDAQMTTDSMIKQDQCMGGTKVLPKVVRYHLSSQQRGILKKRPGEWFELIGTIRHSDSMKLTTQAFPHLSSAAIFWSKRGSTTMTAFKAPVFQPNPGHPLQNLYFQGLGKDKS